MKQPLNCLCRLLVQSFAAFNEHRGVRHFVGQGVLKEVFDFGKCRLFIQKLFALEGGEGAIQLVFRLRTDVAHQVKRKLAPDD